MRFRIRLAAALIALASAAGLYAIAQAATVAPTYPNSAGASVEALGTFPVPDASAWAYVALTGGIVDTANVTLAGAPAAGFRNYVKSIQFLNTDATVGTEFVIKDGATVLWRGYAQHSVAAVSQPGMVAITFDPPLRQPTAATALTAAAITTSAQLYLDAQGLVAP